MTSHDSTNRDDPATDQRVFVRPIGHVDDYAVCRRIGDREVFVGNALAADPAHGKHRFDHVLTVCANCAPRTTHHRPLDDGPDNDWAVFASAVDTARDLSRRDGTLLVHCKAGVSRSLAVITAALATEEGRRFVNVLHEVQEARPHGVPNPALHESGVVYRAVDPSLPRDVDNTGREDA